MNSHKTRKFKFQKISLTSALSDHGGRGTPSPDATRAISSRGLGNEAAAFPRSILRLPLAVRIGGRDLDPRAVPQVDRRAEQHGLAAL